MDAMRQICADQFKEEAAPGNLLTMAGGFFTPWISLQLLSQGSGQLLQAAAKVTAFSGEWLHPGILFCPAILATVDAMAS